MTLIAAFAYKVNEKSQIINQKSSVIIILFVFYAEIRMSVKSDQLF